MPIKLEDGGIIIANGMVGTENGRPKLIIAPNGTETKN